MRRPQLLVEKCWPQIHKLAFALLERYELDSEQVQAILKTPIERYSRLSNQQPTGRGAWAEWRFARDVQGVCKTEAPGAPKMSQSRFNLNLDADSASPC